MITTLTQGTSWQAAADSAAGMSAEQVRVCQNQNNNLSISSNTTFLLGTTRLVLIKFQDLLSFCSSVSLPTHPPHTTHQVNPPTDILGTNNILLEPLQIQLATARSVSTFVLFVLVFLVTRVQQLQVEERRLEEEMMNMVEEINSFSRVLTK